MADVKRLNWSTLKYIATSAKLMKFRVENPEAETDALRGGRSIHCAILEPKEFEKRWVTASICAATTGKGDPCKNQGSLYFKGAWYCGVKGHAPAGASPTPGEGVEVIDLAGMALSKACRDAVHAHEPSMRLLQKGESEVKLEWTDETGIACRGTLDYLKPGAVVDLKSTRRETIKEFAMDAARNLYHAQLAWYVDGAIAAGRLPADGAKAFCIAVSTAEPYDVAAFELSDVSLNAGRIVVRDLIKKYQQCLAADIWPGIAPDPVVLDLPAWAPGMQGSEESDVW